MDVETDKSGPLRRLASGLSAFLPDWFWLNIQSNASLKRLARAWLAAWVAVILLLPNASLRTMGNTAFYGLLMGTAFLPASLPATLFLFLLTTVVAGLCTGWALGVAAMRAALAARDQTLLRSTLTQAKESAAGFANPDAVFQADIFQGIFLDARSSVIFGVFLGVGTFFFAVVRTRVPVLTMFTLTGTIALDIYCAIGPLFPVSQYLLLNSILTSTGMYSAVALFLSIFMFPETINSLCLGLICRLLGVFIGQLLLIDQIISNPLEAGPTVERLIALRVPMFKLVQGLKAQGMLLNAEFAWSRFNGEDVSSFHSPLVDIATRISALLTSIKTGRKIRLKVAVSKPPATQAVKTEEAGSATDSGSDLGTLDPASESHLLRHWHKHLQAQEQHHLTIGDVAPVLDAATKDLRSATVWGLTAVQVLLFSIENHRATLGKNSATPVREQELSTAIDVLRRALQEFKSTKRHELLKPYLDEFDGNLTCVEDFPSLDFIHVYSASYIMVAESVLAFLDLVETLAAKRTRYRLWAPKSLRDVVHAFSNHELEEDEKIVENDEEEVGYDEYSKYRRDPDRKPATNALQEFFASIPRLYRWLVSSKGIFAVRYCFLSIVVWLPAVFRTSAHFYYKNKGVWALIMAQMSVGFFLGDQLFIFFTRIVITCVGLIIGLLIWYIGNGNGTGSPYGLAASTAVFLVPLIFIRIFTPMKHLPLAIILNATVTLIVGYSWIDGHLPTVSVGIGWGLAWRRMLLVTIGCAASFIIMFTPPKSARKAVRIRTAAIMTGLSNAYLSLSSTWIGSGSTPDNAKADATAMTRLQKELVAIATQLTVLDDLTDSARWEGKILGQWPYEDYQAIHDIEKDMFSHMIQFGTSLLHMDGDWRKTLLHQTQIVSPNFISDYLSVFSILTHSLRIGQPIHAVIPRNLLERLLSRHYINSQAVRARRNHAEEMRDYNYMFYLTAVLAGLHLATCLDELHCITRRLCGEVPFHGFDEWTHEHRRAAQEAPVTAIPQQDVQTVEENAEDSEKI